MAKRSLKISFLLSSLLLILFALHGVQRIEAADTLFTEDFSGENIGGGWNVNQGTWVQSSGVLSLTDYSGFDVDQKAVIVGELTPGSEYTITAKVRIDDWSDGDGGRAGLSFQTGITDRRGYDLLFHNDHSTVQWLEEGVRWGPAYTFSWSNDTWYYFKMEQLDGSFYGKVWAVSGSEPSEWMYTWTQYDSFIGYPALNGGYITGNGSHAKASFDDVLVTTSDPILSPTPSATPTPLPLDSSINVPSTYINLGRPQGLVTLPNGNIWYVDDMNNRIVLFDPSTNTILRTFGRYGYGDGEFGRPIIDITRDNEGNLYILSLQNTNVYKFDTNGGFIASYNIHDIYSAEGGFYDARAIAYDAFTDTIFIASQNDAKVYKFTKDLVLINSIGSGSHSDVDGLFQYPSNVTTDVNGKIYVSDRGHTGGDRIQVFSSNYTYLFDIQNWTNDGGGTTGFSAISDVVVLGNGTITASSENAKVVEQFTSTGTHLRTWGYGGLAVSNMENPAYLTTDSSNNVIVSDWYLKSVTKYSPTGTYIKSLRNNYYTPGELYFPSSPIFDNADNMYIIDGQVEERRMQKFSSAGTWIATVIDSGVMGGAAYSHIFGPDGKIYVGTRYSVMVFHEASNTSWVWDYNISGGDGGFGDAAGMAFDGSGNLYVADSQHHRIQKFILTSGQYVYDSQFIGGWAGAPAPLDPESGQLANPISIVFDSTYQHVFVTDYNSLKEYTADGTFIRNIDTAFSANIQQAVVVSIDSNNLLYLADTWGHQIVVYDSVTGELIKSFAHYGSGQMQFNESGVVSFSHDGLMAIGDGGNGRVQILAPGYRILNLIPSANVIRTDVGHVGESLSNRTWVPTQGDTLTAIPARLMFGDYVVADFTVDLTQDRNWSAVNVQTLPWDSKSLVVNLNQTDAPGISSSHSLYLSRYTNQTSVTVCPDATRLSEVTLNCANQKILVDGGSENFYPLSSVSINGQNYWQIDGLTGTGAFSSLFETNFQIRDLMTRLQINTMSNHRIEFGTTYGLTQDGDKVAITFGPEWDMSGMTMGDLTLVGGGVSMTLSDTGPGADIWGYTFVDNVMTFTAPSSGTSAYIPALSDMVLIINNSVVKNPTNSGSYQIDIAMLNSDAEVGSISVPIVDSDQVDVTGFVNAYLNFDIDTNTTNTNCDYNTCLPYNGASSPATNYTVDLGELTSLAINKSQTISNHNGVSGEVNSIYFDLTTNAPSGSVVTVSSANEGLQGPGTSKIPSVTDGGTIAINSGLYGFLIPASNMTRTHGTLTGNTHCSSDNTHFCALSTISSKVFDSTGLPIDTARVRMDIAAAASYTNNPGNYTDTLTFVATGTF